MSLDWKSFECPRITWTWVTQISCVVVNVNQLESQFKRGLNFYIPCKVGLLVPPCQGGPELSTKYTTMIITREKLAFATAPGAHTGLSVSHYGNV